MGEFEKMTGVSTFDPKDFDSVKDRITVRVINVMNNIQELMELPHKQVADLAIIYQISVPSIINEKEIASLKVTYGLLAEWKVDRKDLHTLAMENTKRIFPPTLQSMEDIMVEMTTGTPCKDYFTDKEAFKERPDEPMYVLSNKERAYGANAIVFPEYLSEINNLFPEGYYILPSSTHECIVVPKEKSISPRELGIMVREVNESQVDKEEQLSDRVYKFDERSQSIHQVAESMKRECEIER
ncbi:hypothetical protein M2150_001798 [Lachnospiraceae bacterium PM6-15]|uniref:DUF5688 family protein n=1 Tax=Ohessyouella blattaphilus TaxID=2949333 RepID=UPI003E28F230